jgi:CheY-like chemotaxis protein
MTRVLLVDDDRSIRETVRLVLEDAGYQVLEAADGLAALEMLRNAPSGLVVLLDLMMPKLDGAGVLGVVAGDRRLAQRHTFILTTATHQTLSLAFANLLANLSVPVLRKPFELDELLATVERSSQRL